MDFVKLRERAMNWAGKYRYVLLILMVGILLMLLPDFSQQQEPSEQTLPEKEESIVLSTQLEQTLSKVQGAGMVSVMLTVDKGQKVLYQTDDTYNAEHAHKHDTVIVTDEDRVQSGLVISIDPPIYRGALIVCEGADSPSVRLAIVEAVAKVTGLDSSQISILKMK